MKSCNWILLSGVAAAAMLASVPAAAEDQAETAADSAAAGSTDIIVTAMKRAQNIQDVPISMAVVSGEQLSKFNVSDVRAMMNYTPNVFVQSSAGNNVIYIRGFGSPPANFAFDQSVSLYVDGVYAGRSRQAESPFFDLERVEVLRGPQGALFGKNTAAGAVSVVSAGPTADFEGKVSGLYSFDTKGPDITGYFAGPISDTLGFRVAYNFVRQDGYIHNRAKDHQDPELSQETVRATLKWEPTDQFDYTAKVQYSNRRYDGGITVSSSLTGPQKPHTDRWLEDAALGPEGMRNKSWMLSGTGNIYFGDHTVTLITGYSKFNAKTVNGFDQTIPDSGGQVTNNSVYNAFPEKFDQISQEVRLLSPTGQKFEYIVGAYWDYSNYQLEQYQGFNILNLAGSPYFGRIDSMFKQKSESWSVFGQGTLNFTDDLRVIGSLRYTHASKRGSFASHLVYGPYPIRPISTARGSIDESNVDPSATLQYDFTDRIMGYLTWGKGSKSGGFVSNTLGTKDDTFTFEPEKSTNYEAGIRSTLFDSKVVANVSIYKTTFEDLQVSVYQPEVSAYLTGNAASATSKGIEGSLAIYPVPNFDISASAAYQDVKYDDYPGAACLASQQNQDPPCTPATNNLAGYTLTYSSKFTGNVTAHGRVDLGDYKFDITGVVAGRSKFFNADTQAPTYGVQKGYAKVDLRVQFGDQDDRWYLAFVGKNLTNELTTGSVFMVPTPITAVPRAIMYLEPPRNLGIEAGFKF